jgi:hypothetical protein
MGVELQLQPRVLIQAERQAQAAAQGRGLADEGQTFRRGEVTTGTIRAVSRLP